MPKWNKTRKKIMVPIKRYNQETKEEETVYRYVWYPNKLSRKNTVMSTARKYAKAYGMKPSELVKEVTKIAEEGDKNVLQCLNFEFLDAYYTRKPTQKKQKTKHVLDKLNKDVYEKFMVYSMCEEIVNGIIKNINTKIKSVAV